MKTALLLDEKYGMFIEADEAAAPHRTEGDEAYAVLDKPKTQGRKAVWRVVVVKAEVR